MCAIQYTDRTDRVPTKLKLLESAYTAGNLELAMSLAESIRETLGFERQWRPRAEQPQIGAEVFHPVAEFPGPISQFASGWSFCKPITLYETVGISRESEPIELAVGFLTSQVRDIQRELRLVRWHAEQRRLREVPYQVYDVQRRGEQVHARLALLADCPAHQPAHYLLFFGNEYAQSPNYSSDLSVLGEGIALDVVNRHYRARLSRQHGQLERITCTRQHGLELYAGGKGHGEPPDIDWGHDYVDEGQFQKLRMRNWATCPNFEVVRGPICVHVRRWGFPHSPIHPLFTPSRMHMDVTYSFYSGQPYFMKHGRMEMTQDFRIEAMRDDEWVFSGYSFTDTLWIDSSGRLHEGSVPPDQLNDLWGVGFFHRVSRDAFIALRLEHASQGFATLPHGGAPTLHYDGHGQLWSRYPSDAAKMRAGSSVWQKNAYLLSSYPEQRAAELIQETRHRLLNPLEVRPQLPGNLTDFAAVEIPLGKHGETAATAPLKRQIWNALRKVRDEQLYSIDANVVDLGYVYDIKESNGIVQVVVTMPHRGRPEYRFLESQGGGRVTEGIRERVLSVSGVRDVLVQFTWEPPWSLARLTDAGRAALGLPAET